MSHFVLCILMVGLITTACHKAPTGQSPAADAIGSEAAPPSPRGFGQVAETPSTVVITNTDTSAATLDQLSQELRRYVIRTRSVPKSFDEFAAKTQLQVPAPPEGKRYAIQGQAVVLVNR